MLGRQLTRNVIPLFFSLKKKSVSSAADNVMIFFLFAGHLHEMTGDSNEMSSYIFSKKIDFNLLKSCMTL